MTVLSGDSNRDKVPTLNLRPGVESISLIINGWCLFVFALFYQYSFGTTYIQIWVQYHRNECSLDSFMLKEVEGQKLKGQIVYLKVDH